MNLDEVELQSDPKYKNYVTAVDKALRGFEYSSEWADLISALGKLIKVRSSLIYGCSDEVKLQADISTRIMSLLWTRH